MKQFQLLSSQRLSFTVSKKILLLVALSLVSLPLLAWHQKKVTAEELAQNKIATGNLWRKASFPVENFQYYSSPFGYRRSPTGGSGLEFHSGLDLVAPQGSYVRSWWTGRVVKVADRDACGTHVVIRSGAWDHIYCHMQGQVGHQGKNRYMIDREGGIVLWEGQTIPAGARIGRVGMTGRTTGPHLHWGLKYANSYIDPALVLRVMYAQQKGEQS